MLDIERIRIPPAYQAVYQELQRRILGGTLRPGDALPSETELAARFGVNRSTVREGIRQLESEGLVRREGRKRLLVAVPEQADLAERNTRSLLMHEVTFRELLDVALAVEPLAARLAAASLTEAELDELGRNLAETTAAVERGEQLVALDMQFHTLITAGTRNRVLMLAREPIGLLLYPAFETIRPNLPQAPGRLVKAHAEILAALRRRDAAGAEAWMARHVADLGRGWLLAGLGLDERIAVKA